MVVITKSSREAREQLAEEPSPFITPQLSTSTKIEKCVANQ
jgi:hypothetical protein